MLNLYQIAAIAALSAPWAAGAQPLAGLINAWRAAPQSCGGGPGAALPPLAEHPALAGVRFGTGTFLEVALEQAGYLAEKAYAIEVSGAADARAVMAALRLKYCSQLRSTDFETIGVSQRSGAWLIVLARPLRLPPPPPGPGDPDQASETALAAVNAARAAPRQCGEHLYPPAPPLRLNPLLTAAARAHSGDMAELKYFSHQERDGTFVQHRVQRTGYAWSRVGENIASGMATAQEAVAGWLDSPGHCANIMQPGFTEMGLAYAIGQRRTVYWTQVFAAPR